MITRIKQFIKAITAKVDSADQMFIKKHLNADERVLFYAMSVADQRHALDTAYTAAKLMRDMPQIDKHLLIKAALLHDVGKRKGDMNAFEKAVAVILNHIVPDRAKKLAESSIEDPKTLSRMLYIYYYHPVIGAAYLNEIAADSKLMELVLQHHSTGRGSAELEVLKKADAMN